MKRFFFLLIFVLFFSIYGFQVGAHSNRVDRKPMVEAAFTHMVPMVKLFHMHAKEKTDLQKEDLDFLEKIIQLLVTYKIKINYQNDPQYFDLVEGQARRIMSTNPYDPESEIYVDLEQLEDSNRREIDLIFVFKLLFHELAHKTQFQDVTKRDRIAVMFTEFLSALYQEYPIAEDLQILVLSPSADLIDNELVSTSINLPQPSFIVLGRRDGDITDFTSQVSQQLGTMTSNTRGIWDEFHRVMFAVGNEMAKFVGRFQSAMGAVFGDLFGQIENNSGEINFQELRKLEIQNVKYQELSPGEYFIVLIGYYRIDRSHMRNGYIQMNGLPGVRLREFPVQARILINARGEKGLHIDGFNFTLFQNIDFSFEAKVRQVSRMGTGVTLKIRIPKLSVVDKEIYLIANYNEGYLSVPPQSVEIDGEYKIVNFSIPSFIANSQKPYLADKIIVNSETAVPLDRVVKLNNITETPPILRSTRPSLVLDSVGIWGAQNHQKVFRKAFSHMGPVLLFNSDFYDSDKFSISPDHLSLEFSLIHSTGVREIRLHYSRHIFVVNINAETQTLDLDKLDKALRTSIGLDDEMKGVILANSGTFSSEKITRETSVSTYEQIVSTLTENKDEHKVTTIFKLPFMLAKDRLEPNEAYLPPFFTPHSVEVVLADGTTLVHHFSQILDDEKMKCNEILKFN